MSYKGSYFHFLFKGSRNWQVLLITFIICFIPAVGSNFAWPSLFYTIPFLAVLIGTILHYKELKK